MIDISELEVSIIFQVCYAIIVKYLCSLSRKGGISRVFNDTPT